MSHSPSLSLSNLFIAHIASLKFKFREDKAFHSRTTQVLNTQYFPSVVKKRTAEDACGWVARTNSSAAASSPLFQPPPSRRPEAGRPVWTTRSFRIEPEVPDSGCRGEPVGAWAFSAAVAAMGKRDRADRGETWRGHAQPRLRSPALPHALPRSCSRLLRAGRPCRRSRAHPVGTGLWAGEMLDLGAARRTRPGGGG